jgi:hypothetical protein
MYIWFILNEDILLTNYLPLIYTIKITKLHWFNNNKIKQFSLHTKWPKDLANSIELTIQNFLNLDIESTITIDDISWYIKNILISKLNEQFPDY